MANETVTKSKRFYCVSLLPDICKTPLGPSTPPIPYSVIGEFSEAVKQSPNVKAHSEPVILHNRSVIPSVKGDEPGTAGGIKSGTYTKKVETKTASKTYFANGTATVQEGCEVWMNNRNTVGKIYERSGKAPRTRLEQIAAMAEQPISHAAYEAKVTAQDAANFYKEKVSSPLHKVAADTMDVGGKITAGGVTAMGTGAALSLTGVGAAAGGPLAAVGGFATGVGNLTTAGGAVADASATVLDYTADYILTGKTPDLISAVSELTQGVLSGVIGNKLPFLKPFLNTNKVGKKAALPTSPPPRPLDKPKGGKTKKNKEKKSDKPSQCCPKNKAPGGKPVSSRYPVHFGTGEEVLFQTDFVVEGPIPLEWTRCYRSGSELEDWSICGARWSVAYTASVLVTGKGIVYVDDSGRPVCLPTLQPGQKFDSRKEGFILTRIDESEFMLEWRNGSIDKFIRTPSADTWLPHGYEGINATQPGNEPLFAERYTLYRMQGNNGRGLSITRSKHVRPGDVLLTVRSDNGECIEALCDDFLEEEILSTQQSIRIGRIEEIRSDGTRICHARYKYKPETPASTTPVNISNQLPNRYNLIAQFNLIGNTRRYSYYHHLLSSYSTYTGFEHSLQWISLAALRDRWNKNTNFPNNEPLQIFPLTLENSYQARAVATSTADGLDGVQIQYLDEDTSRVTDGSGGVLEYVFDSNWLVIEVRRINEDGTSRSLGRRIWDNDGMLLAEIDPIGCTTTYTYDRQGNLESVTDALRRSRCIKYDKGNPVAITDPIGNVTHLQYDEQNRLTAHIDALGHKTTYLYDADGRLTHLTNANGSSNESRYDTIGRLAVQIDCCGYRTSYEYDAENRVIEIIDNIGQSIKFTYDVFGNVTSARRADGATERFIYDEEGRLTAHINAAEKETRYKYNGHGLPIERIDSLGHRVQCRYDGVLQLCELTNAKGEIYYYNYDEEGNLTSEIGFDGKRIDYAYDLIGNLVERRCAGSRTQLVRDGLGRLIATQTADGINRFAYDSLDRLTCAISPNSHCSFTYNALGQLLNETSFYFLTSSETEQIGPRSSDAHFSIDHIYDELGNRIRTILPNGKYIDILRYGSGYWHGMLWHSTSIVDLERDALHREVTRYFGGENDSLTATRTYDIGSRLRSFKLESKNKCLRERILTYDVTDNLTNIVDATRGDSEFQYDSLGQLLVSLQPGLHERFEFDLSGNLKIGPAHRADQAHHYNAQGNVISIQGPASASGDNRDKLQLKYDEGNRLVSTIHLKNNATKHSEYKYDALGRRISKQIFEGSTRTSPIYTALFVWDGNKLTQEIDSSTTMTYLYEPDSFIPLARVESPGACNFNTRSFFTIDERYSQVPNHKNFGDEFHAVSKQSNVQRKPLEFKNTAIANTVADRIHYFDCDHIGTPLSLFDRNGNTIWDARYLAWGKIARKEIDLTHQPLRFLGQYEDNETGLYYNRHRYYDPHTARYLTQDPVGLLGGINSYQYAPNPSSWVDPIGLTKTKGGCDPCCGKNPAAEASATQGISAAYPNNPYTGRDTYANIVIKKGTILYSLTPGAPPGFAVTNHTLIRARGSVAKYYDLVQVTTNPGTDAAGVPRTLRSEVRAFRVTEDICVARGKALANTQFGSGGGTQYYVSPSDVGKLFPGKKRLI